MTRSGLRVHSRHFPYRGYGLSLCVNSQDIRIAAAIVCSVSPFLPLPDWKSFLWLFLLLLNVSIILTVCIRLLNLSAYSMSLPKHLISGCREKNLLTDLTLKFKTANFNRITISIPEKYPFFLFMFNFAFYTNLYSFSGPLKHHLPLTQTLPTIFRLTHSTNYLISLCVFLTSI